MNLKLILGLSLVLISLIAGKITTFVFILNYNETFWRYLSIMGYITSWLVLFLGVYICGIEGKDYIQRIYQYFNYKYYHSHAKNWYQKGKDFTLKNRKKI